MEQKLSHYRRHKFETNPYKARQHDAMYTVMVLLDFFCNFTLTLLIFFFIISGMFYHAQLLLRYYHQTLCCGEQIDDKIFNFQCRKVTVEN